MLEPVAETEAMTKDELETRLLAAVAEMREASGILENLSEEWARADHYYRQAKAVAYLASEGTIPERTAAVDKACKEERQASHTAEALREAAKEKLRALMTEISAYQTIAGLMRSEMSLDGRYER